RHGRPGEDGRQHDRAAAEGRARGGGVRPVGRGAAGGGGQGGRGGRLAGRPGGQAHGAPGGLGDGAVGSGDRLDHRRARRPHGGGRRHRRRRELQLQGGRPDGGEAGGEGHRVRRRRHLRWGVGAHRGVLPDGRRHRRGGGGGGAGPQIAGPR